MTAILKIKDGPEGLKIKLLNENKSADSLEAEFKQRDWITDLFVGGWEPVAHAAYEGFSRLGPGVLFLKKRKGQDGCSVEYSASIKDSTGQKILTDYDPETQMLCGIADAEGGAAVQRMSTPAGCPTPKEVAEGEGTYWQDEEKTSGRRRVYVSPHRVALNTEAIHV